MYSWVTHTWNPVKGRCFHGCSYCFMTKWKNSHQKDIHIDDAEFMTDLGAGNFIFVGSSVDLWAMDVPNEWILRTLDYCDRFDSRYRSLLDIRNASCLPQVCFLHNVGDKQMVPSCNAQFTEAPIPRSRDGGDEGFGLYYSYYR